MTNHQMNPGPPRRNEQRGQTLVEFALILPVLLLLMMAIVDFGRLLFTYAQASNALRTALRYGAITGLNQASPQYLHCATIGALASDQTNVFFAKQIDTTIIYTDNENDAILTTYDMAAGTGCPDTVPVEIDTGDRMTIHNEISVDLVTPIMSQYVPTLTFTMEGTRTLTGGGIAYGEGISVLDAPTNPTVVTACNNNGNSSNLQTHYPVLTWDTSTDPTITHYWIRKDSSWIAKIPVATANANPGGGTSGCTGIPGNSGSCYDTATPYDLTDPDTYTTHDYVVHPYNGSDVGPGSTSLSLICPVSQPPDSVTSLTVTSNSCGFGDPLLNLSWSYPAGEAADNITEYRIYDAGSNLVATIPATATSDTAESCTDCDPTLPGWDGAATTYSVTAVNTYSQETLTATSVAVSACSPLRLYLQNTTTDDSGGTVPAGSSNLFNNAMNVACDPTASDNLTVNVNGTPFLENDYAFWTQPFDGTSLPYSAGSTATFQVYHTTAATSLAPGDEYYFDVTLQHCTTSSVTDCTIVGTGGAQLNLHKDTSAGQRTHTEATIDINSNFTVLPGQYLRVLVEYSNYTGTPTKNLTIATGSSTATPACSNGNAEMSWLLMP